MVNERRQRMSESPTKNHPSTQEQRTDWMHSLVKVVRQTGEYILGIAPQNIFDTGDGGSHQFSTADGEGSNKLRRTIADVFGAEFNGTVLEESKMPSMRLNSNITYPLIVGDAIEGSTNAKRGLTAYIQRPTLAGTSVFILEDKSL